MTFLAPGRLVLLVVPLVLLVAYVVAQRRRAQYALRFTNLELLDKVAPHSPGWRRHLPAAALLAAVTALALAAARPAMSVEVVQEEATVVLAVDVSLSMDADDVDPNRLEAAKEAAYSFMAQVPEQMKVGLVAFSATIRVMAPPTIEHSAVDAAIGRLQLDLGTAIGEAIFASLDLIAQSEAAGAAPGGSAGPGDRPEVDPEGDGVAATILVLSDGETTDGRPDADAAALAAELGVRVSTIAFGTDQGIVSYQGEQIPVPVNAGALERVAETTGGAFFDADSADDLRAVFEGLGSEVGRTVEDREVTDWFAVAGLVLAGLAATGSLVWFSRLP